MGRRKSFTHTILFGELNDTICRNKTHITIIFYHAKYPISFIPQPKKVFAFAAIRISYSHYTSCYFPSFRDITTIFPIEPPTIVKNRTKTLNIRRQT